MDKFQFLIIHRADFNHKIYSFKFLITLDMQECLKLFWLKIKYGGAFRMIHSFEEKS